MNISRKWVPWLLALLILVLWPLTLKAHTGGVLYLANEPAGDFEISTWVLPQLVTTAEPIHFDILVLEPAAEGQASQEFVLGAAVVVRASTLEGDLLTFEDTATNINSENKLFYEAVLDLPESGQWQIDVIVNHDTGQGEATIMLLVERDSQVNWYMIGAAAAVIIGAAIFVLRSRPQEKDG